MSKPLYATAQDAEAAFYDALSRADLEAMMSVWADDEDIYCVHPQGPRLSGLAEIRESWRRIFGSGQSLKFQLGARHAMNGMMFAVHSVHEIITVAGESRARPPVIATNVYMRTERGWRMVAHHASPAPADSTEEHAPPRTTLH